MGDRDNENPPLGHIATELILINSITIAILGIVSGAFFLSSVESPDHLFSTQGLLTYVSGLLGNVLTCITGILFALYSRITELRGGTVSPDKISWDIAIAIQGIVAVFINLILFLFAANILKQIVISNILVVSNSDYRLGALIASTFFALLFTLATILLSFFTKNLFKTIFLPDPKTEFTDRAKAWARGAPVIGFYVMWIYFNVAWFNTPMTWPRDFILATSGYLGAVGWIFTIIASYAVAFMAFEFYIRKRKPKKKKNDDSTMA